MTSCSSSMIRIFVLDMVAILERRALQTKASVVKECHAIVLAMMVLVDAALHVPITLDVRSPA